MDKRKQRKTQQSNTHMDAQMHKHIKDKWTNDRTNKEIKRNKQTHRNKDTPESRKQTEKQTNKLNDRDAKGAKTANTETETNNNQTNKQSNNP